MPTVSVVIPVYRAEGTLRILHGQLSAAMTRITPVFEIIFVEDCGGDGSSPVIVELAAPDERVPGIRMSRNCGQHNAPLRGIRAARHEVVVAMDDDCSIPLARSRPCSPRLVRK